MKKSKLIFVLFLSLYIIEINAQDLILKQDGTEIKARVLEITDQQVKYVDYGFQSGPIRNINITDVFMITYENGQKEVFNKQPEKKEQQSEEASKQKTSSNIPYYEGFPIVKTKWNAYLLQGNGKSRSMNNKELVNYFSAYCPEAHYLFEQGLNYYKRGTICYIIGGAFCLGGYIGMAFTKEKYYWGAGHYQGYRYKDGYWICLGLALGGSIDMIIGASVALAGHSKTKKAIVKYNNTCVLKNKTTATLNVGITQNGGFGLTLNY